MTHPTDTTRRLIEFFGLRRGIVGVLVIVILVGMGEKMAERFLPIYLLALGGGTLAVGILNGLQNLLGALYSFPGGYLADRLGTRRSLLVFNLMSIFGYLIVVLVPSWEAVLIGAVLFMAWSAISLPAMMSLVAQLLPKEKRTMGVSMHSLVRRIPMALGPIVGGLCIQHFGEFTGVQMAFRVAILMALVAILVQERMIPDDPPRPAETAHSPEARPWRLFVEMPAPLKSLLVSDILVRFAEQIPYAFVVVWCMKTLGTPEFGGAAVDSVDFGILTTVEMITAMLIYVPVAYYADRFGKKWFVVATFGFFTAFPFTLYFCRSFWPLVFAFFVRGLKEFGEPTRKALIMDLAPEGRKAAMFGLYYLLRDIIVSLAAFASFALWDLGPGVNLITAGCCGLVGTLWFAWRGQDLPPVKVI